jgi:hypothetical protein
MQNHEQIAEGVLWCGMHGGDSLVERMFGEIARMVGAPADIMEVDGKVEGNAKAHWVPH